MIQSELASETNLRVENTNTNQMIITGCLCRQTKQDSVEKKRTTSGKTSGSWGSFCFLSFILLPRFCFLELRLHWCANFKRASASHLVSPSSVRQTQQRAAHQPRTVAGEWNQARKVLSVVLALLQTSVLQLCRFSVERMIILCLRTRCQYLRLICFSVCCVLFCFLPGCRAVSNKTKWNIIWLNIRKDATRFHNSSKLVSKSSDGAVVWSGVFLFIHISVLVNIKAWKILPGGREDLTQQHMKQQNNALLWYRGKNHKVVIKYFQSVHSKTIVHQRYKTRSFIVEEHRVTSYCCLILLLFHSKTHFIY